MMMSLFSRHVTGQTPCDTLMNIRAKAINSIKSQFLSERLRDSKF